MSKKIMRIAQDGMLYVNRLNEGDSFSINPNFVEIGGELIEGYPFVKPVIDDSLILWLDGSTGNNYEQTGTWKDLSGNGNDGELVNFGYTEDSGWVDGGLRFDGVDDYVQLPDLALNPDNFTIQVDNKIRAFNGDKVITENGDEWGRNLLGNTAFNEPPERCASNIITVNKGEPNSVLVEKKDDSTFGLITKRNTKIIAGEVYTLSFELKTTNVSRLTYNYLMDNDEGNWSGIPKFNLITDGNWHYYKATFTSNINRTNCGLMLAGDTRVVAGANSFEIRKIKLEKGSQATPWTPAPEDITATNIINHNTPFVKNSTIHTLRFYNRALTDEEILQNYQAGQCSPLLAMRGQLPNG